MNESPKPLRSHTDRLLARHLDEVGRVAALILARHPLAAFAGTGVDAAAVLGVLAGWHDIAKATAFFQDYIVDPEAFNRRAARGQADPRRKTHTPLGAVLAMRHWSGPSGRRLVVGGSGLDPRLVGLLMMLAIRGHHSQLPSRVELVNTLFNDYLSEQLAALDPAVESCHPSLAAALADLPDVPFETFTDEVNDLIEEAGVWLGEKDRPGKMSLDERIRYRLTVQFCFSCLLEADKALLIHDDEAQYRGEPGLPIAPTVVEDHPPPGGGSPRLDWQRQGALAEVVADATSADLADLRPRVLTLPTGLGKTRCAAAWAFHLRERVERETGARPKIFVVLPFLSIIEQTARVYRRELLGLEEGRNDETLGVSHSLSCRDYGDLEEPGRVEFALDTWRSDVVLTTFDQFLLALLDARTRHQQRFHNLCDAIIVLDEVQAFPCRLWHPVGHVLRGLADAGRARVLLMTATQPGLLGPEHCAPVIREPAAYVQSRYRLEYDPVPKHLETWLPELAEEVRRPVNGVHRKWLIVLNTRRSAQEAYRFFREEPPRDRAFLLSSDIVPLHRLERIEAIREAPSCIVLSTQCVEAGVDLDMDRVIRDFGPLDSLIQVAGRCNRHGLRPRVEVRVVCLHDDRGRRYCDSIYDPILLDETAASLQGSPLDEEGVAGVVEDYFRRLHQRKDTGQETTHRWSRFEHAGEKDRDDLNFARLLRGDQEQIAFVVGSLDTCLRGEVEEAFRLRDRWARRRDLRRLAPRIALVTVSAWKSKDYTPSDIADPVPAGIDDPSFWFLHDDAYDPETGLCPAPTMSAKIF